MPILDELKKKAIARMNFSGEGGENSNSNVDTMVADNKIQFVSKGGN